MIIPTGALPPKRFAEFAARYFLQKDGLPKEYSPSFALDSDTCFSKIVAGVPVISPVSSKTTT